MTETIEEFPSNILAYLPPGISKAVEMSNFIKADLQRNRPTSNQAVGRVASKATLVVCPPTRLFLLETEFKREGLKVSLYPSPDDIQCSTEILVNGEVVLTTYQCVTKEIHDCWPCRSPLKDIYWTRIVLFNAGHRHSSINAPRTEFSSWKLFTGGCLLKLISSQL